MNDNSKTGLAKRLESAFRKALYDYEMINGTAKIAVALSGGKDSLTLLTLLKEVSGRGFPAFDICAIHVDGEFSCGAGVNANYLKQVCERLEVPLILRSSTQVLEKLECYSCSRERRSLIFDAAKEAGATTIAFGHHLDDQAETVMMNLLHKAEFEGQQPKILMYEYGVTLIRPLIYIREADIRTFAEQQNFLRIMCRCPVGQTSMRQKVHELLDQIENLYPNARENIARAVKNQGSNKALRKSCRTNQNLASFNCLKPVKNEKGINDA